MEHLAKTAKVPVIVKIQRSAIKSMEAAFLVYARKVGVVPAVTQVCTVYQYYMQVFVSGNLKPIDGSVQRTFQLASVHLRTNAEIFRIKRLQNSYCPFGSDHFQQRHFYHSELKVQYRVKSESTFLKSQ